MSPGACGLVPVTDLLSTLNLNVPQRNSLTREDVAIVTLAIAAFGFGLEPDPHFAGPLPALTSKVVIFREPTGAAVKSLDFLMARTEVEIAALVAADDGQIDATEAKEIVGKIKAMSGLSNTDKVRLIAYLAYLVSNPPSKNAVKQIANRDIKDRTTVANAAFETVARKGEIRASDVRFLERTYDKLNLPKHSLLEKIDFHKANFDDSSEAPPLVRNGEPSRGISIPVQKKVEQKENVQLDGRRIIEIRTDTIRVSAILSEIFEQNGDSQNQYQVTSASAIIKAVEANDLNQKIDQRFPGLDSRLAQLLSEIWEDSELDHKRFANLARKHGLMPSGAIEMINDWSFTRFEQPLLDDGQQIIIARDLIADVRTDGNQ